LLLSSLFFFDDSLLLLSLPVLSSLDSSEELERGFPNERLRLLLLPLLLLLSSLVTSLRPPS